MATVEFAVVAPLILVLLLGTIDVGQFVNVGQAVSNASRVGARTAVRHATESTAEVENAVTGYFAGCFPAVPEATVIAATGVTVTDANGYTIADWTALSPGEPLSVEVEFDFSMVRWLSGASLIRGGTLEAITTMRRE